MGIIHYGATGAGAAAMSKSTQETQRAYVRDNLALLKAYPVNKARARATRVLGFVATFWPCLVGPVSVIAPGAFGALVRLLEPAGVDGALGFACLVFASMSLGIHLLSGNTPEAMCIKLQDPKREQKYRWRCGAVYVDEKERFEAFAANDYSCRQLGEGEVTLMEEPEPRPYAGEKLPACEAAKGRGALVAAIILFVLGVRLMAKG